MALGPARGAPRVGVSIPGTLLRSQRTIRLRSLRAANEYVGRCRRGDWRPQGSVAGGGSRPPADGPQPLARPHTLIAFVHKRNTCHGLLGPQTAWLAPRLLPCSLPTSRQPLKHALPQPPNGGVWTVAQGKRGWRRRRQPREPWVRRRHRRWSPRRGRFPQPKGSPHPSRESPPAGAPHGCRRGPSAPKGRAGLRSTRPRSGAGDAGASRRARRGVGSGIEDVDDPDPGTGTPQDPGPDSARDPHRLRRWARRRREST